MPTPRTVAIVDAGPIFAAADAADIDQAACLRALNRSDLHLVVPALVLAEVAHFAARDLGTTAELAILRDVTCWEIACPTPADWTRTLQLVAEYADLRLGTVDATVIALAERLRAEVVITLDHRHFRVVRPVHCEAFTILP
jgi:predicted nucleic acid-binding protein